LLGRTAGRTTLAGEGLQHQDGHSPSCARRTRRACPTTPLRLRARGHHRTRAAPHVRPGGGEDVFYYLTIYNENYEMPARPDHVTAEDIVRGMYLWARATSRSPTSHHLVLGAGAPRRPRRAARPRTRFGVGADLWSVTSLQTAARRCAHHRAVQPAAPLDRHAHRSSTSCSPPTTRSSPSPTT
jgi:pyruvate dehydrogenase E1 component